MATDESAAIRLMIPIHGDSAKKSKKADDDKRHSLAIPHWQSLSRFESYDFVARWYKKAHERAPKAAKISQINACFTQGREYFANAATAAMSVKPLLLYYGILSLSRGVILANHPYKKEESLMPSHGLEQVDWQHTLSGGIKNVLELRIRSTAGTFSELVEVCHNLNNTSDSF